jgi:hypothetical protein
LKIVEAAARPALHNRSDQGELPDRHVVSNTTTTRDVRPQLRITRRREAAEAQQR